MLCSLQKSHGESNEVYTHFGQRDIRNSNLYPSFPAIKTSPSSFPSVGIVSNCPFVPINSLPTTELACSKIVYLFLFCGERTTAVDTLGCDMIDVALMSLEVLLSLCSIFFGCSLAIRFVFGDSNNNLRDSLCSSIRAGSKEVICQLRGMAFVLAYESRSRRPMSPLHRYVSRLSGGRFSRRKDVWPL